MLGQVRILTEARFTGLYVHIPCVVSTPRALSSVPELTTTAMYVKFRWQEGNNVQKLPSSLGQQLHMYMLRT